MKNRLCLSSALLYFVAAIFYGCSKGGNSFSTTDHTVGMIKSWTWSGTSSGYIEGDSITSPLPDTTHVPWAKAFSRTITDTSFDIERVNGFTVEANGVVFNYEATDSIHGTVTFDTTISAGWAKSVLTYYYAADSMTFEYHVVPGYNATQGVYYQTNEFLHTVAP